MAPGSRRPSFVASSVCGIKRDREAARVLRRDVRLVPCTAIEPFSTT